MANMTTDQKLDQVLALLQVQGGMVNELVERLDDFQDKLADLDDRLTTVESK